MKHEANTDGNIYGYGGAQRRESMVPVLGLHEWEMAVLDDSNGDDGVDLHARTIKVDSAKYMYYIISRRSDTHNGAMIFIFITGLHSSLLSVTIHCLRASQILSSSNLCSLIPSLLTTTLALSKTLSLKSSFPLISIPTIKPCVATNPYPLILSQIHITSSGPNGIKLGILHINPSLTCPSFLFLPARPEGTEKILSAIKR